MTDLFRRLSGAARAWASAALVILALGAPVSAVAQYNGSSVPLNQLQPRGSVAAADLLPDQPNGTGNLESIFASDLAAYVKQAVANGPIGADPTGANDSTSALQSWFTAGSPGTAPCGTYKTSATLTISSVANAGQQIAGSGAGDAVADGACRTVIQPTSAVTTSVILVGNTSGTGSYTVGVGLKNFAIDLVNSPSAIGVDMGEAFDISLDHIRVINGAWNECAFQFENGSYVTTLDTVQGNYACWNGTSANAPTTQSFKNADLYGFKGTYLNKVQFRGGAMQPPYNSAMSLTYLPAGDARTPSALSNTGGIYLVNTMPITHSTNVSIEGDVESGGGYPATCNDGTHGSLPCFFGFVIDSTDYNIHIPLAISLYAVDLSTPGAQFDCFTQFGYNLGGGAPADLFQCPSLFRSSVTLGAGQTLNCDTAWGGGTNYCSLSAANGDLKLYPRTNSYGVEVYMLGSTVNLASQLVPYGVNIFNCISGNAENVYSDNGGALVATLGCWQNDANAGELALYNPSNSNLTIRCSAINGVCLIPSYWEQVGSSGYGGDIVFLASLTTTAATSDTISNFYGTTSSSHCSIGATNSSAASNIATTYVSAKATNSITVSHTATAGMTYDVLCSSK